MSAQHTPQWRVEHRWPECWSVDMDETGTTQASAIVDASGAVVAFAVASTPEPFGQVNTDHDALIAAAPDLLAALLRAVDAGIGSDGKLPSPADQARAAIAAARGQA